jgi:hypothetical protein
MRACLHFYANGRGSDETFQRETLLHPFRSDSLRVSRRCQATRPQRFVTDVINTQAREQFSGKNWAPNHSPPGHGIDSSVEICGI